MMRNRSRRHARVGGVALVMMVVTFVVLVPAAYGLIRWAQSGSDFNGPVADGRFGSSVAVSADGSVFAAGAPANSTGVAGSVQVFARSAGGWVQRGATLQGAVGERTGKGVALSGDGSVLVVGEPGGVGASGSVKVYEWGGVAWTQRGLTLTGATMGSDLGASVAVSNDGTVIVAGSPYASVSGVAGGSVRVFAWDGTNHVQRGSVIPPQAPNDRFGWSVAISSDGSVIAAGAKDNDGDRGDVRVFEWDGTDWVQRGGDLAGDSTNHYFGATVDLSASGSRVAAGSRYGASARGYTKVFEWSGSAWNQVGVTLDGEAAGDESGAAVNLNSDGNRLAVGAVANDGGGNRSGHVRTYDWNGTAWIQAGGDIDGEAIGDESGMAVSMSGDGARIVIGAPLNDGGGTDAGHVRVYDALTVVAPGPPRSVTAAGGDGFATVTWQPPLSDGNASVTGYTVTASPGAATCSTSSVAPAAPATSCVVTGLVNGTTYSFSVTAANVIGAGAASEPASGIVPRAVPASSTSVAATPLPGGRASVEFVAGAANGSAITSHTATCTSSDGGAAVSGSGGSSPVVVSGLSASKTYSCSVVATNGLGNSAPSSSTAPFLSGHPVTLGAVTGRGSVSDAAGIINCGTACSAIYPSGSLVTLTATAAVGSKFSSWGGACSGTSVVCSVLVSMAREVTVSFVDVPSTSETGASASPVAASRLTVVSARAGGPGRANVRVDVPGGGRITITGTVAGAGAKSVCASSLAVRKAGSYSLTCSVDRATRATLVNKAVRVRLRIVFTPTVGVRSDAVETVLLPRTRGARSLRLATATRPLPRQLSHGLSRIDLR